MMITKKLMACLFIGALFQVTQVNAATVYDFDEGIQGATATSENLTSFTGMIQVSEFGTYTTAVEIESYLNSAIYSFEAFDGTDSIFVLDNSNSQWSVDADPATSMTVNADEAGMSFGFETPAEYSDIAIILRNDDAWNYFQIRQSNNVGNSNFFSMSDGSLTHMLVINQAYDSEYSFAGSAAVPVPGAALLFVSGLVGVIGFRFRRN